MVSAKLLVRVAGCLTLLAGVALPLALAQDQPHVVTSSEAATLTGAGCQRFSGNATGCIDVPDFDCAETGKIYNWAPRGTRKQRTIDCNSDFPDECGNYDSTPKCSS